MPKGTVKWFNSQKGYGFIEPQGSSKDVLCRVSAVERAGLDSLNEGQVVEYEEVSNRGKTSARKHKSSALSFVKSPPTDHRSFDASAGYCVFPQASTPPGTGMESHRCPT